MPPDLPLRLRFQITVTQWGTKLLRSLGLREAVMELRLAARRARRNLFERYGSARYSFPALHGIDRELDRIIDRDGGYFVEAGGHDGYTQSNTYYLERFRGWTGVLVEPMRELAREGAQKPLAGARRRVRVVSFDHGDDYVDMHFGDLFSNVDRDDGGNDTCAANGLSLGWRDPRSERVPARPLSSVLDEARADRIDLLSLDVEGYEAEVLRGLDLSLHAPAWIIVEMHELAEGRARIGVLLGDRYVEYGQLSPLDDLYRRRDVSDATAGTGSAPSARSEPPS